MYKLNYSEPADKWTEALPLGNGRIGAMQYGGIETEKFQLNEDSLWSGPPIEDANNNFENLEFVRELIDQGEYKRADVETKKMLSTYTESYLPLGNLYIQYLHGNNAEKYKRSLDINESTTSIDYEIGGVNYKREAFISFPHQTLAVKLTSSKERMLNVLVSMDSPLVNEMIPSRDKNNLILRGICPEKSDPVYDNESDTPILYGDQTTSNAIRFESQVNIETKDGHIENDGNSIYISDASKIIIYFTVSTSFKGFDKLPGKDFKFLTTQNIKTQNKINEMTYSKIKRTHTKDYQNLFNRVELSLNNQQKEFNEELNINTDKCINDYGVSELSNIELLFQYGRYLLISSSREGTQPANLQGIWNDSTRPPWSSNYTLNINTPMNYWMAETANLSECHTPLLKAIKELSISGQKMVENKYKLKGWTVHHNTDIWRNSYPVNGEPIWSFWPLGGPWLSRHLWEHFLYNQDKEYLINEALPIMEASAEFCLSWLREDENGYFSTSPSSSPEHPFYYKNELGTVTKGATMDLQIIWDLFSNCIAAYKVLGIDDDWIAHIKKVKHNIHPLQIGQKGQIQEWQKDYNDSDLHHRHLSHLYGLYPGNQIHNREFIEAAKQTLNIRGDEGTGWSLAWKICLWARLKDGERINSLFDKLFNIVTESEMSERGGVYPNLLGAHPPFQIDGNFGFTAGVIEMLVQSHNNFIELLPALPSSWINGKIAGIKARGGFIIDVSWSKRKINNIKISSLKGKKLNLKSDIPLLLKINKKEKIVNPIDGIIEVKTETNDYLEFKNVK